MPRFTGSSGSGMMRGMFAPALETSLRTTDGSWVQAENMTAVPASNAGHLPVEPGVPTVGR
jgi:hypothetical protein